MHHPLLYSYLLLLLLVNVACWRNWSIYKAPEQTLGILLLTTLVSESWSVYLAVHLKSNVFVSHIYSPTEFLLISLYFNNAIKGFHKHNLGKLVGVAGFLLSAVITLFFQHINQFNSYFLLFEATVIIIYCLLLFRELLLDEEHPVFRFANFWIALALILFWSLTFTGWGVYSFHIWRSGDPSIRIFDTILKITGLTYYGLLCGVFMFYKRLIPVLK